MANSTLLRGSSPKSMKIDESLGNLVWGVPILQNDATGFSPMLYCISFKQHFPTLLPLWGVVMLFPSSMLMSPVAGTKEGGQSKYWSLYGFPLRIRHTSPFPPSHGQIPHLFKVRLLELPSKLVILSVYCYFLSRTGFCELSP